MGLMTIVLMFGSMFLGFVGGVIGYYIYIRANVGVSTFLSAVRRKKPLVFLETDKTVNLVALEMMFQGLGVTKNKEIVVIPDGTLKYCPDLKMMLGHGDFFRSITIPKGLRLTINDLKRLGWNDRKIAEFFYDVSVLSEENIIEKYEELLSMKDDLHERALEAQLTPPVVENVGAVDVYGDNNGKIKKKTKKKK